ncbi:hypothetical protein K3U93_10525 [Mycobacterium malmoense]|uniref:hypothetical protein n=1 Tax=Mycobacterium malmoense TaxID=1780 RepID=UPI00111BF961|nr:hypothetical protein [Mycobacterium malmoense]QZA19505.1 hypothetical protein K3U93_10525 [Mycobacterium malmoense]UNB96256.1 hypothetical protein H5T25_10510 [Mycobacterium malmoense]
MAAAPAQTAIYRFDEAHEPRWQFHSMPESIVGGGKTLDEAREQYRDALRFSLGTDRLPKIREYVEEEAHLGIWVRTPMTAPGREHAFEEIARQISFYPREDLEWFYSNPSAGGDAVVIPGAPDDSLDTIFNQMTPFDSLIVVMGLGDGGPKPKQLMWLVIAGSEASADPRRPPVGLTKFGLTPGSSLRDVFAAVLRQLPAQSESSNKLPPLLAPAS